jgi:hypothetical protein
MARVPLILVCLALALQPAPAQTLTPGALAPGKPAGTRAAQQFTQRGAFIAVSIISVALVFALPASSTASTSTSTATSTGAVS